MSKHTPGPDPRGNYWFDCGCMINGVQQQRCPLHHAAPDLLAALPDPDKLETLAAWLDIDDVALRRKKAGASWVQDDLREWASLARAAIAAAKGEA